MIMNFEMRRIASIWASRISGATTLPRGVFVAAILVAALGLSAQPGLADNLWPGEQRFEVDGFPTVAHFQKGDPGKPLVVFVPGAYHNARIAYGGHDGSKPEDFLAAQLAKKGFSFLALSYPIATKSEMISQAYPEFSARIWGQQVAEVSRKMIADNGLSDEVVMLAWSMGGKSIQPAYAAMTEAGLDVVAVVSLAATPGLPGLIAYEREYEMLPSGYATRPDAYDGWLKQLAATAEADGTEPAIPESIYRTDYVGDIPIGIQGYGQVYRNGAFEFDTLAQAQDYGAFDFANYPFIAILEGDSTLDSRHALLDRSYWTIYNANTAMARYQKGMAAAEGGPSPESWAALQDLVHGLSDELTVPVGGNHFFFVGAAGAARTADAIEKAIGRIEALEGRIGGLLVEPAD